jgi:hypothetical protein
MVVVVPPSAEIKGDESRQKMRPDQIVKIGDLDVVATVLGLPEEKALELIPDITKEPTLELLKNKETRGSVLSAVTKQIETIKSMNVPKKENR